MKCIENYTLNEMKSLLEDVPYDKIEIVYGYLHRDKTYIVENYARSKNISLTTLYRYIKTVKDSYKRHSK